MAIYPKLRPDLNVHVHPEDSPERYVTLRDPVSERYYQLSYYEFALLEKLDGTRRVEDAVGELRKEGKYYSFEIARNITAKAAGAGLLLGTRFSEPERLLETKSRLHEASRFRGFARVYFLFIPILNPDRFLDRTLWIFNIIANRKTLIAAAIATPPAVYLLIDGIPRIRTEYLFFFNWTNLLHLWVTIAFTKLVHEFAHAYTAKRFGLSVPEMGVAFLIFFPCLYCNTTDAWQLADRRQRAAISAAGIAAEAVLALISIYIWYFTRPGLINSLAFYLMTVSFVSTVLFNANPLLKFDGYFILIDILGRPNLAANSTKYLKYLFFNRVLGNSAVVDPARTQQDGRIYTMYGIAAFLYRIVLYTGIVAGVYFRFDKTLGMLLAVLAVALFIIRPISGGVLSMVRNRRQFRPRPTGVVVFLLIVALIAVPLCIPWSSRSLYPCYVRSDVTRKLTVPLHTLVEDVFIGRGSHVNAGEKLFELDTSELSLKLKQKEIERQIALTEIRMALVDTEALADAERREVELNRIDDEIMFLKEQVRVAGENVKAPFSGVVTKLDDRFQKGFRPGEGVIVGSVESPEETSVHALVPAEDIAALQPGMAVELLFPVGTGVYLQESIVSIRPYSERDLKDSPFSSRFGGELAVEESGERQKDSPLEAQYDCVISLKGGEDLIPLGMTGRMAVDFAPRSIVERLRDKAVRLFNRESLW